MDRQIRHIKSLLFQLLQGVEHRVMLNGVGNNMLFSLFRSHSSTLGDSPVVSLGAAAGEIDFPGFGVQAPGDGLSCAHQRKIGLPSLLMERAGVAVELSQSGKHGLLRRFAHCGGGRVVSVNEHGSQTFFLLPAGNSGVKCTSIL